MKNACWTFPLFLICVFLGVESLASASEGGVQPGPRESVTTVCQILSEEVSPRGAEPRLEPATPPTEEQLVILEQVFGESVAFDRVRYWYSPFGEDYPYTFVVEWNVFFSYERAPDPPTWHLSHELTHVWQQTVGGWTLPEVVREMLRGEICTPGEGCVYDSSVYDFYLNPSVPFVEYGMEQQAEIVETYYLLLYEDTYSYHCLNCAELGKAESLLISEYLVRQEIY